MRRRLREAVERAFRLDKTESNFNTNYKFKKKLETKVSSFFYFKLI